MDRTNLLIVAIYLRISQDPLNLRAGVDRQRKDCTAIANLKYPGCTIVEFIDNDVSAWSGRKRPAFIGMCEAIADGTVEAVVGYNFDRVFRLPKELEAFLDLCAKTRFSRFHTAVGDIDLSTDDGQLHARILAAVAKKSSDDTSRRVRSAFGDLSSRGLWTGPAPYGYRHIGKSNIELDPAAAKIVRKAVRDLQRGCSLNHLVREYSSHPGAPRTTKGWRATLTSLALAGFSGSGVRGTWKPILTPPQHADMVSMFNARSTYRTGGRSHWLSGLLWCERCKVRMRGAVRPGRRPTYRCMTCTRNTVDLARVEKDVASWLFARAPSRALDTTREDAHMERRAELERRLEVLAADYAAGEIGDSEWRAARSRVRSELQQLPDTSARSHVEVPLQLSQAWVGLTPDHRHSIARRYLDRIDVLPPDAWHAYSMDRLDPTWIE